MSRYARGRGCDGLVHGIHQAFDGNPYWRLSCLYGWDHAGRERATRVPDDAVMTCLTCLYYGFDRSHWR